MAVCFLKPLFHRIAVAGRSYRVGSVMARGGGLSAWGRKSAKLNSWLEMLTDAMLKL